MEGFTARVTSHMMRKSGSKEWIERGKGMAWGVSDNIISAREVCQGFRESSKLVLETAFMSGLVC